MSQRESLAISQAMGLMSTPCRQRSATSSAGVDDLVFGDRVGVDVAVGAVGFDDGVGEVAAGLDEEGPGSAGGVADLEIEDLFGGA